MGAQTPGTPSSSSKAKSTCPVSSNPESHCPQLKHTILHNPGARPPRCTAFVWMVARLKQPSNELTNATKGARQTKRPFRALPATTNSRRTIYCPKFRSHRPHGRSFGCFFFRLFVLTGTPEIGDNFSMMTDGRRRSRLPLKSRPLREFGLKTHTRKNPHNLHK